ncbi:transcriptional regulatory protein AlgP-like [Amyelois transitella]|uniref:transcriptional regulatory protein AlgP-like n=1 Tax=Amyelois transitella TaxID=680683 RepID=UPI00298F6599|nr:transcriptional regulatory protein AlgP-like [Amyelois transitella]
MRRDAEVLVRLVHGDWLSPGMAQWMAIYLRLKENEVRGVAPSVDDLAALDIARRGMITLPPVDMETPWRQVISSLLKRARSPTGDAPETPKKPRALDMREGEEESCSTAEPSSSGSTTDLTGAGARDRPLKRAATMASVRGSEAAAAAAAAADAAAMKPPPAGKSAIPRWQSRDPRRAPAGAASSRAPAQASAQTPALAPAQTSTHPHTQAAAHAADRPPAQESARPPSQAPALAAARPPNQAPALAKAGARPSGRPPAQPGARPSGRPPAQPGARPSGRPPARPDVRPDARPSARPSTRPTRAALAGRSRGIIRPGSG